MNHCEAGDSACGYALQVLPPGERASVEAHIAACPECQAEVESLHPVLDGFVAWPTDLLRPTRQLQRHVALRIARETGKPPLPPAVRRWREPDWEQVAPGIECKLLATDGERSRVSMLVRLAAGASYPPHIHDGVEELHPLDGELWIDGRRLLPGDCSRAGPGTADRRVWSETGCTCVLVTSTRDILSQGRPA